MSFVDVGLVINYALKKEYQDAADERNALIAVSLKIVFLILIFGSTYLIANSRNKSSKLQKNYIGR
jgi:hypothetical protein